MSQVGLDIDSPLGGVCPGDDHRADVSGPGAGYILPAMMARKFIGETASKVICLADIYRIPTSVSRLVARDVDAADGIERDVSQCEVLKLILRTTHPGPNEGRDGVD